MFKHYAAGFVLITFAVFAFPYNGADAWPVFVYGGIFAAGAVLILTSPCDEEPKSKSKDRQ
jgi:hypothetical protein